MCIRDRVPEGVSEYTKLVRNRKRGGELYVEFHLTPYLTQIHPNFGGTADAIVVKPDQLEIFDYKSGWAEVPHPSQNPQLIMYALGAKLAFGGRPQYALWIVQPERETLSASLTDKQVEEWKEKLLAAASAARSDNPPFRPGKHCRFCPALALCPSMHQVVTQVSQIDPEARLEHADAIQGVIAQAKEQVGERLLAGVPVPGWKVVPRRSRRVWTDETQVVERLGEEATERSVKSVARVEKELGVRRFRELVGDLVAEVSSGLALVRDNDPRPALPAEFPTLPEPGGSR